MSGSLIPTAEQIETLRDLFFKKLEREGTPFEDGLDARDINRIETSNLYLQKFLETYDLDMKQALKTLWDTCLWRKAYGTNDINEHNVNQQHLYSGIIFAYNRDIDGKTLLICKTKLHQKGKNDVDDLIRLLVYWVERLQREENYAQISLVFDMNSTGLSNMDMEFTKRIIETFKFYYPYILNYIIIFDMPWVLSAAFKIVKSLLPPKAVAKMKFVNQKTISDYVDESNALSCWGGKDNYVYSFVPENRKAEENRVNHNNNNYDLISQNGNESASLSARKVHFANSSPPDSPMSDTAQSTSTDRNEAELLRITPDDAIVFMKTGNELVGTVEIMNISYSDVTYKIKTTSPEKFRVRPSSGCLSHGASTTINVVLQQGQSLSTLNKDKFLVMAMPLSAEDAGNTQAIAELWKNTPTNSPSVEQRRLKCTLPHQMAPGDGLKNGRVNSGSYSNVIDSDRQFTSMLSQLTETTSRLENQIKFSQSLQWITLTVFMLLSMAVVYILKQEINQSGACHSEF